MMMREHTRGLTRRRPLCVETLEDRTCLNAAVVYSSFDQTLYITGTNYKDHVTIEQDDAADTLTVTTWMQRNVRQTPVSIQQFTSSQVRRIRVDLRGGDDQLTYRLVSENFIFRKDIGVELGAGNDQAVFDFGGYTDLVLMTADQTGDNDAVPGPGFGKGDLQDGVIEGTLADDHDVAPGGVSPLAVMPRLTYPTSINQKLTIKVNAGSGDDVVDARFGSVGRLGLVAFDVNLGSGNDSSTVEVLGTISGGQGGAGGASNKKTTPAVLIKQQGGEGDDTLLVDAGAADVGADGRLEVRQGGGNGADVLGFYYAGLADGLVRALANGGNGADKIEHYFRWTPGSAGALESLIRGGNGDDDLTAILMQDSAPTPFPAPLSVTTPSSIIAKMDGGPGTDIGLVTSNVLVTNVEALTVT